MAKNKAFLANLEKGLGGGMMMPGMGKPPGLHGMGGSPRGRIKSGDANAPPMGMMGMQMPSGAMSPMFRKRQLDAKMAEQDERKAAIKERERLMETADIDELRKAMKTLCYQYNVLRMETEKEEEELEKLKTGGPELSGSAGQERAGQKKKHAPTRRRGKTVKKAAGAAADGAAAHPEPEVDAAEVARIRKVFDETDANNDGELCLGEVADFCKKLGLVLGAEEVKQAMAEMELEDSTDQKVDFDEFLAWWSSDTETKEKGSVAFKLQKARQEIFDAEMKADTPMGRLLAQRAAVTDWGLGTWVFHGEVLGRLRAAVGAQGEPARRDGSGGHAPGPGNVEVRWGNDMTISVISANTLTEHAGGWAALSAEQRQNNPMASMRGSIFNQETGW